MKVLFVLDNNIKYYSIDDVVRDLIRRGHEVVVVVGQYKTDSIPDDALQKAVIELANFRVEPLIKRRYIGKYVRGIRELLNYAYILKNESMRRWDVSNWGRYFHPFWWKFISARFGKRILKNRTVQKKLRFFERMLPIVPAIRAHLLRLAPDILIAIPLISGDSREGEYVQAAKGIGIPTVFSMFSWDNITTKGTFHSSPDFYIVWNEALAKELVELHGIPREQIYITGAQRFDRLIDTVNGYILPREDFCRAVGLDADRKYILYVCSTFILNEQLKKSLDEDVLILEITRDLERHEETKGVQILVRPHPQNLTVIPALLAAGGKNISVFPNPGEFPDTEEKRQMFYNSIFHSFAVVGVNTTAFLEAAALDKPCITVIDEVSSETQQLPHFHHLANAGFLEIAHNTNELAHILKNINAGVDAHADNRSQFVRDFLRPTGHPAVKTYVELLETLGGKYHFQPDRLS